MDGGIATVAFVLFFVATGQAGNVLRGWEEQLQYSAVSLAAAVDGVADNEVRLVAVDVADVADADAGTRVFVAAVDGADAGTRVVVADAAVCKGVQGVIQYLCARGMCL